MPAPIDNFVIEDFIFHVVHHGEEEPVLMDETPLGKYDVFFKRRIAEILNGNKFEFQSTSAFLAKVKTIQSRPSRFIETSKDLAIDFHSRGDQRVKPGVMILIRAKINSIKQIILIKYDHEEVIYYKKQGTKAVLAEISNTFSKSKEALQKAAVIPVSGDISDVIIIDKSERHEITTFFKNFLGVKRKFDNLQLTQKIKDCYLSTVKEYKNSLPTEYTSKVANSFYQVIQNNKEFDPATFPQIIFGQHYTEELGNSFLRELTKIGIEGEIFEYDKNIPRPKQKKFKTAEGVAIQFPQEANDSVQISHLDNMTKITITTSKLVEET